VVIDLSCSTLSFGTKTNKNSLSLPSKQLIRGLHMPAEIFDVEKFVEMSGNAKYCSVKRLKGVVKLKLRTPNKLYTLKVEPLNAEETIKKLKCEIQEL
jgi:hypothetical protein